MNIIFIFVGKPDPVYLTCVISLLYTIQCNWNTPYTLPEFTISKYNINITNEEELVKQVSLTGTLDTQYTYNVSEFGTYTISITAVISEDLEGERNETIINIETGKLYLNICLFLNLNRCCYNYVFLFFCLYTCSIYNRV